MSSRRSGRKADQTKQTPGPSGSSGAPKGRRRQPSKPSNEKKQPSPLPHSSPRPSTSKPPSTPKASARAQPSTSAKSLTRSSLKRSATDVSTEQSRKKTKQEVLAGQKTDLNSLGEIMLRAFERIKQGPHFPPDEQRMVDDVIAVWELFLSAVDIYRQMSTTSIRAQLPPARFNPPSSEVLRYANTVLQQYADLWTAITAAGVSPSEFAKPSEWPKCQADSPILCLRPPAAIGLPLYTLYDGFRNFMLNISSTNFETTRNARLAAAVLCERMGESFISEADRSGAITKALKPLFPDWTHQQKLEPYAGQTFGLVDRVILLNDDFMSILGEDKWECGSTASDGYMHIARDFDLYVHHVRSRASSKYNLAYLAAGTPAFLMVIQGPSILICGGFHDGRMTIVAPLMDPILMLRDPGRATQKRLARVLTALEVGHQEIVALIQCTESQPSFPPCTPRLYQECEFFDTREVADLRFERPWEQDLSGTVERLTFLATLHRRSTLEPIEDVIVKLAPNYGVEVHQYLATNHLAPRLYAKAQLELSDALTAYIMERLPSQWVTLHSLEVDMPKVFDEHSQKIYDSLKEVLRLLEAKGFVHGDLRSNNVMIDGATLQSEGKAEIKIVDFNWSGKASTTCYPELRNPEIIGWPGVPGGPIEQQDDAKLLGIWWPLSLQEVRKRVRKRASGIPR